MKSFNKALSAAALLAVSGLSFAAEPMVLGANDLDQVNAGFSSTWGANSGVMATTTGLAGAIVNTSSSSSSGFLSAPYAQSTSYGSGMTAFNGSVSLESYASAGIIVTP